MYNNSCMYNYDYDIVNMYTIMYMHHIAVSEVEQQLQKF